MLEVNTYFDGKVKSIALQPAGKPETVGVMDSGEYEFGTQQKETMIVVSGQLDVRLPGESKFKTYRKGDQFEVPANSRFQVKVSTQAAYLCQYG